MHLNENIIITELLSVVHIRKNRAPGTVDFYFNENSPMHNHELVYRIFGEVETDFNGIIMKNAKGTIEFLPEGCIPKTYKVTTLETGECIAVYFHSNVPLSDKAFCTDNKHSVKLHNLFMKIHEIWLAKNAGYHYEAMTILYKILTFINQHYSSGNFSNSVFQKIEPAVEYINNNFCNALDYEYAASLCNISYSHFRHLFKDYFGESPAGYVIKKRIEYSKELLQSNRYNISQTAEIAGFSDVYYFSRMFKKNTGSSPTEFLNSHK